MIFIFGPKQANKQQDQANRQKPTTNTYKKHKNKAKATPFPRSEIRAMSLNRMTIRNKEQGSYCFTM